ncbi:MAG TPA: DUF2950 domain-containing protein, partial [Humisphaera sp.]|nr:DUF2950 domain-containing protein [Humisphaera sp.]
GDTKAPQAPAATQPTAQAPGRPAPGQPVFDSDGDVVNALLVAVKGQDHEQVHRLLGPAWKELTSGDKVEDAGDFKDFAARAAEHMRIEKEDDSTSLLRVGHDDWLFPIPIVKSDGKWFFDTEAGKAEVLARRIGQDELEAIAICRLYVKAQHEYACEDRDGSGVLKYAQRNISTPGKRDGLYWDAAGAQRQSPLGRLIAEEKLQGYEPAPGKHMPYRGYTFRVLKRQGANAPGGKIDYVINGNMTGGFALIAYPVAYASSGIMTFIVNQEGRVYQKDLGADTARIARHIKEYDPDGSWTLVKD